MLHMTGVGIVFTSALGAAQAVGLLIRQSSSETFAIEAALTAAAMVMCLASAIIGSAICVVSGGRTGMREALVEVIPPFLAGFAAGTIL